VVVQVFNFFDVQFRILFQFVEQAFDFLLILIDLSLERQFLVVHLLYFLMQHLIA